MREEQGVRKSVYVGNDYIIRKRKKRRSRRAVRFLKKIQRIRYHISKGYRSTYRRSFHRSLAAITAVLLILFFSRMLSSAHESFEQKAMVPERYYKSIMVENGDTLWEIAEKYLPEDYESIEEYVYTLMRVNNLHNSMIEAGQQIIIVYNHTNLET